MKCSQGRCHNALSCGHFRILLKNSCVSKKAHQGSMETSETELKVSTNCDPCNKEGETTKGTNWCFVCKMSFCDQCFKVHSRLPATRFHGVTEITDEFMIGKKRKITCQHHQTECHSYCRDCNTTFCQSCSAGHKECKSISSLEETLPGVRTYLEERKETLNKKITEMEKRLDSRKSQHGDMKESKSSIQAQIRATSQKVLDVIRLKEEQLMLEVEEIAVTQAFELKEDIISRSTKIQSFKQHCQLIDWTLNSDSEVDMCSLYQTCESGPLESSGGSDMVDTGTKTRIQFSQNTDKINKVIENLKLGKIKITHDGVRDLTSKPGPTCTKRS